MKIPTSAYSAAANVGKMYFFKIGCPIGIADHIHVCIHKGSSVYLFAVCSSQVEKAKRRAQILGYDLSTYPIFRKNRTNQLNKDETYIDCNKPIETSHAEFARLIRKGLIYEMKGVFDAESLRLISEGIKASDIVEDKIKDLF